MFENIETFEDLKTLNVKELGEFLKIRGVRCGGKRAELLQLARLYFRFEYEI